MARARLGHILQTALRAPGIVVAPIPQPDASRETRELAAHWLYAVGVVAAGMFAAGSLLAMMSFVGGPRSWLAASGVLLAVGAVMLGAVWLATFGRGIGGALPILGCAAVPISLLYVESHIQDRFYIETTIAILGLGFAGFAGGHLLARDVHVGVRVAAAFTLVFVAFAFTAEAWHWDLPQLLGIFYTCALAGLAATATLLAVNLAFIAHRARINRRRAPAA